MNEKTSKNIRSLHRNLITTLFINRGSNQNTTKSMIVPVCLSQAVNVLQRTEPI